MNFNKRSNIEVPEDSLLFKYIIGDISADEKAVVEKWAEESADNEKILIQLAKIYYAQKTQQRIENRNSLLAYQKVHSRIRKKSRRLFFRRITVAASFTIGILGLGSFFLQYLGFQKDVDLPSLITVQSNDNSRTQVVLPDGTEVHLNSSSTITYPSYYTGKERKVALEGEAYFKVTHNTEKPFIVSTADQKYNVKVLGTEFNMQAFEEDNIIQTTLVSGSIQLDIKGKNSKTILTPSQKAIYSLETNDLKVITTDTNRETDWMYNRLVFKDTPMSEVLARLTRFYNVEFDVKNRIINTYTFTGTFEDKPLYQVLDYMKISSRINYNITYQKDENGTKSVVELRKKY